MEYPLLAVDATPLNGSFSVSFLLFRACPDIFPTEAGARHPLPTTCDLPRTLFSCTTFSGWINHETILGSVTASRGDLKHEQTIHLTGPTNPRGRHGNLY